MAGENARPTRLIYGQPTMLARTMHDIRYDEVADEIYVANPFAQAVLVFRGAADGQEAPVRVIQGPSTQLSRADRLELDTVNREIIVPERDRILVFPMGKGGDVAPIRVLIGPDTRLRATLTVVVDPVHNLMVHSSGTAIVIHNRTDAGNAKPRAVIEGPKTGMVRINQMQLYAPKGWIVATMPGPDGAEPEGVFVGIWSVNDNGNVAPRWKIDGPKSGLKRPRGVALNPKRQEIYVADMRLNSVLTYYFPEMF
jgi:hypothetical protein